MAAKKTSKGGTRKKAPQSQPTEPQRQPMELKTSPLIVIIGAFNDKIFRNREWDANYLFDRCKPEDVAVNLKLNVEDDKVITIVACKGVELSLVGNRLQIKVPRLDDDGFSTAMDIVTRLAANVPHTPITAFGINFDFETKLEKTDDRMISSISLNENWKTVATGMTKETEYGVMTCQSELERDTGSLKISFNFHNDMKGKTLTEVKNNIIDRLIENALGISRPMAENIRRAYEGAEE